MQDDTHMPARQGANSTQKPPLAPHSGGHKGTFFVACLIVAIAYAMITGRFPGFLQGALLVIPVIIVKALLDSLIGNFPGGKQSPPQNVTVTQEQAAAVSSDQAQALARLKKEGGETTNKEIHIREYPNYGSRFLGVLHEGNQYKIISEKGPFEQIEVYSGNDITLSGWIEKSQ